MSYQQRILILVGLFGTLSVMACGGGGSSPSGAPTPSPSPSPTPFWEEAPGLTGNYGSQLTLDNNRLAVLTLSVTDPAGTATGGLYVFLETNPARSRHFGTHPLVASGQLTGRVDPTTRALTLTGNLINQDGSGSPTRIELTGTLMRSGTDHGNIDLSLDGTHFLSVFQ